jgi:DNA recombination-mediator protein A
MFDNHRRVREQAAVLALVAQARGEWYLVAQLVEVNGSALRVARRDWTGLEPPELLEAVRGAEIDDAALDRFVEQILDLKSDGVSLVTVLDDEYPTNLRLVYSRPPFLFARGELRPEDDRALAVVGTRSASADGREQASRLARDLVDHGATGLSGLALGVDTAAHDATLAAGARRRCHGHWHSARVPGAEPRARRADRGRRRCPRFPVLAGCAADPLLVPDAQRRDERHGRWHGGRRGIKHERREDAGAARARPWQATFSRRVARDAREMGA